MSKTLNRINTEISCKAIQELMSSYIDGELQDIEKEIINSHTANCAVCRAEFNQIKLLDWNLRFEDKIEIPDELAKLREQTIAKLISKDVARHNNKKRSIYELQQRNFKRMTSFIGFLPGSKIIKETSVKIESAINQQVANTSKTLIKKMIGF